MGGTPSFMIPQKLPKPIKTYTPKSIPQHKEIEDKLINILITGLRVILWKIVPTASAAATIAGVPTVFFNYINLLTSIIDLLSEKDSIDPIIELMNKNIAEESARSAFASIKAKINTIKSRLNEMFDTKLNESDRNAKANIAIDKCEEILCLFDNDNYILWDMGIISSSILVSFSIICAEVINLNYEKECTSPHQLKKMKGQLISVLEDYKKQCVVQRLNHVTVETRDSCSYGSGISIETYGLGHSKFENDEDTDLNHEWDRSYHCVDKWDDWKERKTTYASIINYRKLLICMYEKDFDDIITRISNILVAISTTNEYTRSEKKFAGDKVIWNVAPT